ncbi:MAG: hypothetical protein AAF710_01135 [Planctomycetota bacterium]
MRVVPHHPLSVQLIEESIYGPGRFEPFGPPLRLARDEPCPPCPPATPTPPVTAEPPAAPGDLPPHAYTLGHVQAGNEPADDPHRPAEARTIAVPVTLPGHLVGSLLDVLA